MLLYFIRHGKPKIINNNFYEAHLSDNGLLQTRQLATLGKLPKPDLIFSSPYNRAVDTAKALSIIFGIGFETRDFLKEWNIQSSNLPDPDFTMETNKGWKEPKIPVRGEESLDDVRTRAYDGTIQTVSGLSADVIYFISHGTLIELVCAKVSGRQALQSNVENMRFLDYAEFEFKEGILKLVKDVIVR